MKIICPYHKDTVPSLHIYDNGYFCFVCRASGPLSDLNLEKEVKIEPKYVEDIESKRAYIETLPKQETRGLLFPSDHNGYYITWNDSPYYKLRLWNPKEETPKYKCPSGHPQSPLWVRRQKVNTLFLVEGEINALSLAQAFSEYDICSPGSASEMMSRKYLTDYSPYDKIYIVVDRDPAGTMAAITLKTMLMSKCPYVTIILCPKDCNQILVEEGKEKLRERMSKAMQGAYDWS